MPNIKSAKKRVLVNKKKNATNRSQLSTVKTAIKKVNAAIEAKDLESAQTLFVECTAILDKAASKGLIHKNTAANKKSGLAKKINALKA